MARYENRRDFLKTLGLSTASLPFLMNLPSLGFASSAKRKKRLVIVFSPNGVVPWNFWPEEEGGKFTLKESLKPFEPFKDRMLTLNGVCDKIKGDGDGHMKGIGCLLTGIELLPGNIQGGSDTPAGWSSGISIDQEIKNFLQANPETRTRFGSLEFGVLVPDRADTWTRISYAGSNKPIAPVNDPYEMFSKMYGKLKDQKTLKSVLDNLHVDFEKINKVTSSEDQKILEEHAQFVREMEQELTLSEEKELDHIVPELEADVKANNDNMPRISRMQTELLVNSFVNDFTRIATVQYTKSVGSAKMRWLGIEEGHHALSHKPDKDKDAQDKLTRINKWYAGEVAHLAKKLAETPEPGREGSLLDNTLIVWTNELGKGNNHTRKNTPFVLIGNGHDFNMGRSLKYKSVTHNRLLLSLAHGFGHELKMFGNPNFCGDGPLTGLT
jgi:Protein of unknown function (DUF1552)